MCSKLSIFGQISLVSSMFTEVQNRVNSQNVAAYKPQQCKTTLQKNIPKTKWNKTRKKQRKPIKLIHFLKFLVYRSRALNSVSQGMQGFTLASVTLRGNRTEPGILEKLSYENDQFFISGMLNPGRLEKETQQIFLVFWSAHPTTLKHTQSSALVLSYPEICTHFDRGVTDWPPSQRMPGVYLKSICFREVASKTPFGKLDQSCTILCPERECLQHCIQLCLASLSLPSKAGSLFLPADDRFRIFYTCNQFRYFIDLPLMSNDSSDSVSSYGKTDSSTTKDLECWPRWAK